MEIDFLGLNSPNCKLEQNKSKNPYIDSGGGVETSLSLCSSSSLNSSERKKWEFTDCEKISSSCTGSAVSSLPSFNHERTEQLLLVAPPVFRHFGCGGFLYDRNDSVTLRNMSQQSIREAPAPSLAMLYPTCLNVYAKSEKVDQDKVYISGNAYTGHTPTVAMARRATLARFLEKRLHRMSKTRVTHIMPRSKPTKLGTKILKQDHDA